MTLQSAVYVGRVRHRRRAPRRAFTFPLFMMYLDLAELDRVLGMSCLWGRAAWRPARFKRGDYLGPETLTLDEAVRQRVAEATGRRPSGPIRVLTHLRYFGYIFNPVSFYYCFDAAEKVSAIIAEITNTPWGERHSYVLDVEQLPGGAAAGPLRWRFAKDFHVSPFMPMDLEYDWTFTAPSESLFVHMNLRDATPSSPRVFDATLQMQRREITPSRLRGLLVRYPLMTLQVIGKIHLEALGLWLRRAPVFPHPHSPTSPVAAPSAGD